MRLSVIRERENPQYELRGIWNSYEGAPQNVLQLSTPVRSLEPGKQFLTDQFHALFEAIILESQIEYQVFDASRAKFLDLRGAVIRIPYNQETFQVLDRLKLSGRRLYPVAASLRTLRKSLDVDTRPSLLSVLIDARDRYIAQSNFPIGELPQILYPVVESCHGNTSGNPAVAVFRRPSYRGTGTTAAEDRNRFGRLGLDGHVFE